MKTWCHREECTDHECYCIDADFPDPVCDCGAPGWACQCEKDDYAESAVVADT